VELYLEFLCTIAIKLIITWTKRNKHVTQLVIGNLQLTSVENNNCEKMAKIDKDRKLWGTSNKGLPMKLTKLAMMEETKTPTERNDVCRWRRNEWNCGYTASRWQYYKGQSIANDVIVHKEP